MEFVPFDPDADIQKSRRHLPHWEQAGRTYFVTFRLCDSIPESKLDDWMAERSKWQSHHPRPWSDEEWEFYRQEFLEQIERWSDRGYGTCLLRDSKIRRIVSDALLFFDAGTENSEERCQMGDFVIMPNHVHLLVRPLGAWELGKLIHSWKSFSAHRINQALGRTGSLWMDERFDHLVRNELSLKKFQHYIEENPRKAKLKEDEFTLRQGNAT